MEPTRGAGTRVHRRAGHRVAYDAAAYPIVVIIPGVVMPSPLPTSRPRGFGLLISTVLARLLLRRTGRHGADAPRGN